MQKGSFLKDPCMKLAELVGDGCAAKLTPRAKKMTILELWQWNGWTASNSLKQECGVTDPDPINDQDMKSIVDAITCLNGSDFTYGSPGGACCCCW